MICYKSNFLSDSKVVKNCLLKFILGCSRCCLEPLVVGLWLLAFFSYSAIRYQLGGSKRLVAVGRWLLLSHHSPLI